MTALDWATTTTHTPVVCPPDPDAMCRHCGTSLEHHQTDDGPGMIPTPDNAVCLDDAALLVKRIRHNRFALDAGQSFDCPDATFCETCGVSICSEHSTGFTACVDNRFVLHHLDCVEQCDDCMRGVAEAADEDRAIEAWKGLS